MNILFIEHFFVGFMVSEIPRVSVFGHCPYSVISPTNDMHYRETFIFILYIIYEYTHYI